MTDTKHTPGPWEVIEKDQPACIRVYQEGCPGDHPYICEMLFGVHRKPKGNFEQRIHNARLIAAAPDLLAACKRLVAFEKGDGSCLLCGARERCSDTCSVGKAQSAIAKAEGADQ